MKLSSKQPSEYSMYSFPAAICSTADSENNPNFSINILHPPYLSNKTTDKNYLQIPVAAHMTISYI